jgi:hypothetical protein
MSRKQRIDTATAAVGAMIDAAKGELMPAAHANLNEAAMPFWREIVRGRARDEWEATPALMTTAASLAWVQWQVSRLRADIENDDVPEARAVQRVSDLQRLEMGYLRVLQQHGRGAQGEARDVSKRRSITAGIVDGSPLGDDLIARPSIQ